MQSFYRKPLVAAPAVEICQSQSQPVLGDSVGFFPDDQKREEMATGNGPDTRTVDPETKTPTCMSGRCVKYVLGGPGGIEPATQGFSKQGSSTRANKRLGPSAR